MTRVQQILTATLMLLTLLAGVKVASAAVPAIVMSNHQTLYSSLTNGTSRVSANARGDLFFADPPNHRVLELPAGSTTPVVLLININRPLQQNLWVISGSGSRPSV